MDYELLFPGRFIKSAEFQGKAWTVTIKNVYKEKLPGKNGRDKVKGIVALEETEKEWVLNRTNAECVKEMFGRDTSGWHGKRVTLYPAAYEGKTAIRVKGSPDIEGPMEVLIDVSHFQSPYTMLLEKTPEPKRRPKVATKDKRQAKGRAQKPPRPALPPAPESDPRIRDDDGELESLEAYAPYDPR